MSKKKIFLFLLILLTITNCNEAKQKNEDNTNSLSSGNSLPSSNFSFTVTGYGIDPTQAYSETLNNVYYLDANSGNDSTGGGTSGNPWRTLAKVQSIMASGDTIILGNGNYGQFVERNAEIRTDWITIKGAAGSTPVIASFIIRNSSLKDTYLRFDNIDVSYNRADSSVGIDLKYVKYFEIRNSTIRNNNHKYETDVAIRINYSENILIYYCELTKAMGGMTITNTKNVTISRNHIHELGGSTGIQYYTGNSNFIVEKNNIYDSNYDPSDPNAPDDPHASGMSVRSSDVWIRQNIFHDIGTSSGIMFYDTGSEAVTVDAYNNIIIENNLFYDIPNTGIIRMYKLGADVYVINNTVIGHLRDISNANYKFWAAFTVSSFADGYDGSGLHVYNNIMLAQVILPQTAKTANNIFWSYSLKDDRYNFLTTPPDPGTKILTGERDNYPLDYITNNFFTDNNIDVESDFTKGHGLFFDFRLSALSDAINFGDPDTQSGNSLGSVDADGFIRDDGKTRDANSHSVGAYEIP